MSGHSQSDVRERRKRSTENTARSTPSEYGSASTDVAHLALGEAQTALDCDSHDELEESFALLPAGQHSEKESKERHKSGHRQGKKRRELLYKMEEGGTSSSIASSSANSSDTDLPRLGVFEKETKMSRVKRRGQFVLIHVFVISMFVAFLYGASQASRGRSGFTPAYTPRSISNGTHTFAPTTILISLDGFRADFLARNLTPALDSFMRSGTSAPWMSPSFPSLTFPNHYTLVTGMYPESHGIVGNNFWDPTTEKAFYYTDPSKSMFSEWWDAARPIWETAELAGVRTAVHMWPGSEAHIGNVEPSLLDQYNGQEHLDRKVDRILSWLDLPSAEESLGTGDTSRPQLIAAYVPNVDKDGHKYGPNSTQISSTIREVDGMLDSLFHGLEMRNLTDVVNVIIVSDHGMATTSTQRLIQFEDLLDPSEIEHTDGWPLYGLRPFNTTAAKLAELHARVVTASVSADHLGHFDVYLRDVDMPKRYHFANHPRIAPLWIVPRVGWTIVTKDEFDVAAGRTNGEVYHPRGLHGYDHEHPLMRAIFLARGPAFPHAAGSRIDPFANVELYNIVCDSIGLQPESNNGTLRLPLRPSGLYDFSKSQPTLNDEIPDSPPSPTEEADVAPNPSRPEVHDGLDPADARKNRTWWEWVQSKIKEAENWVSTTFSGKGNASASNETAAGR